jgi:uncharacterized membrane protein
MFHHTWTAMSHWADIRPPRSTHFGSRLQAEAVIESMATTTRDHRTRQGSRRSGSPVRLDEKRAPDQIKSAHIITEHIEVGVPAAEAYGLWTRYDDWSQIFKNESAKPRRSSSGRGGTVQVQAKIGPSERKWTAEIVGTERGHRVTWRSKGPLQAVGSTSFHRLDDRLTKVMVEIEYRPRGPIETVGNFFRMPRRRVRRDLRLFKNFAELGPPDGDGKDGDDGKDGR